jgi:pyridoxamine 5'-phosphate oxidase
MTIIDCIQFANENPVCFLSTVESDQPRVRVMGFWFADESGFYFQTSIVKEIPGQIKLNPNIEVCFYKHEGMIGTMLRVAGQAEIIEDLEMKEKAIHDRPFLKDMGLSADNPKLFIFRIAHGQAHFWNMESNMRPKEYIHF